MNLRRSHACLGLALLLANSVPSNADILVVNAEGTGQYPTIQAAVDAAVDGDEIHLATGEFTGDGNRDIDVHGKAILIRSQTVNPPYAVINTSGKTSLDIYFAFAFDQGEGRNTVLENINFFGGYTDDNDSDGSIRITESSPTIRNCEFQYHTGTEIVSLNGSPLLENCNFYNNTSIGTTTCLVAFGGSPEIINCRFEQNGNDAGAGAAYIENGYLKNCHFEENSTDISGGSLVAGGGVLAEDCNFNGFAHYSGGAVVAWGGSTFRRCSFSSYGVYPVEGIYASGSPGNCVTLVSCSWDEIRTEGCVRIVGNLTVPDSPEPLSLPPFSWGAIKEKYR